MSDIAKVTAPAGCLSIDVGGVRHDVKDGHATVHGPFANQLLKVADAIDGSMVSFGGCAEGTVCTRCHRTGWEWESTCPRCGEPA